MQPYIDHAGGCVSVSISWSRWGGGAAPGKTHIFSRGAWPMTDFISLQCVVDDFGTLVPVERP